MDINLNTIENNVLSIKNELSHGKFCAVIKANAYGHGINAIHDFLCPHVDMFAVSSLDEAQKITSACKKDILILSGINSKKEADIATVNNYIVTIKDVDDLAYINKNLRVHIKVDSGMNRLGVKNISDFLKLYNAQYRLEGIYSHFYNDNDVQYDNFLKYINHVDTNGLILHMASSGSYKKYPLDMCRIGIKLYDGCQSVYGKVIQVKNIKKGEIVSYNAKYISNKNQKIAIIKIGYGDGFLRKDGQHLIIHGHKYPVIGNVCMDMCMIAANGDVGVGDNAYYIQNNVHEISNLYDTIDYQVLTLLAERIERNYVYK